MRMTRLGLRFFFMAQCLAILSVEAALAQEGTWAVSVSSGVAFLGLKSVEEEGQKDIDGYHNPVIRFPENTIPIGPYPSFGIAPVFSGRVLYRYDRDFSIALSVAGYAKQIETSYRDAEAYLLLQRKVGATDIILDVAHYFPPLVYGAELYAEIGIGKMFAYAQSYTAEDKLKSADTLTVTPKQRSAGDFEISKLFVSVGTGIDISITSWLSLKTEARYKFAPVGRLDGELKRFDQTYPYTTTSEFDFSSLLVTSGLCVLF